MPRRHHFTLLEMLVAVTVLAVLMPAVGITFSVGLRSYRSTSATANLVDDGRGALLVLQNDLARAVAVDLANNIYENKRLSFVLHAPDTAYQRRVTYMLDAGNLVREVQPLFAGDKSYDKTVLVENVQLLSFEYRIRQNWELKPQKGAEPLALRVQLQAVAGDRELLLQTAYGFPAIAALDDKKS